MYKLDVKGNKQEVNKYSEDYFNVWKNISFINGRDVIENTYIGNSRNVIHKVDNETLNNFLNDKALRLIDLAVFLKK